MKLSKRAVGLVNKNIRLRTLLALGLDKHVQSVERYIDKNESNGPLTTAKALQIISEETGLTQDEILEDESIEEPSVTLN